MSVRALIILGCAALTAGAVGAACSAGRDSTFGGSGEEGGAGPGAGGQGEGGLSFGPGSGGSADTCDSVTGDGDGDGYTVEDGDCNDCDVNVSPGAVEVPTDPTNPDAEESDEDCDGEIDESFVPCDTGLAIDDADPLHAAQALELCETATEGAADYGVLEAKWVRPNGQPATLPQQAIQFGIQTSFGPNVTTQLGESMLSLSSGFARVPGQAGASSGGNFSQSALAGAPSTAPPSFPQDVPNCAGSTTIYDDIGLEVRLRAPTNATGFRYLFKFYTFEFAEWVCTDYNDQYVALVAPPPMGSINGNISFDGNTNPVSVNIAFFDVCDPNQNNDFGNYCNQFGTGSPCPTTPSPYCPAGAMDLAGTGFDDGFGAGDAEGDAGGTVWLQTTAPVDPSAEFTIRFAVWDTGDPNYDSTVLIDGFEWIATPGTTVTTVPPPR